MNTILALMYAADLASGVAVVSGLVGVVVIIVWLCKWGIAASDQFGDDAFTRTMPNRRMLWIAVALFVVSAAMPSKTTLYAAAALQAGDTLANSQRGQKVLRALDTWLQRQADGSEED